MESGKASLADLFENELFYEIPSFQRPFSWDKDNFQELVDDLWDTEFDTEYFLGSIVYYAEDKTRMVVDGQQRLTSLMILLACIRDLIENQKIKDDIQRMIVQPEDTVRQIDERERLFVKDRDMFKLMVTDNGGTNEKYDARDYDEPSNRYVIARSIFRSSLEGRSQDDLINFLRFVSTKCIVIYLEADSFDEAFRLFEVVNDRGKSLRRIDLLKSHNLNPAVVPSKKKRALLANQWEQDEASINEKEFESLFNMIRLIHTKSKPAEDLYSEFKNRIFDRGRMEEGEGFFEEVTRYVDIYKQIFQDYDYLNGHEYERHFMALMSIMDDQLRTFEWRACVLAFAKKFGRENLYTFCLAIEKVTLLHSIEGVRKDERYADFTRILTHIESAKDGAEFAASIEIDTAKIEEKLTTDDLYKKPHEKYVLLRLELAVAEMDQMRQFTARTAEHVFPQNPEDDSEWAQMATEEERKEFVNKLGNLILLSKGKNSSASNRDFEEKKQTYLAPRVSDFPRSSQVLGYKSWDRAIIEERTKEAASLVLRDPGQ